MLTQSEIHTFSKTLVLSIPAVSAGLHSPCLREGREEGGEGVACQAQSTAPGTGCRAESAHSGAFVKTVVQGKQYEVMMTGSDGLKNTLETN